MKSLTLNGYHEDLLSQFSFTRKVQGFNRGAGDSAYILCREYLHYLERCNCRNVTESTASDYKSFLEYLRYRTKRRGSGKLSKAAIRHIRYAVHCFYTFLFNSGSMKILPVTRQLFFHIKQESQKILTESQVQVLFDSCIEPIESAILALAYGCGLRRSEMYRLKIAEYKPGLSVIIVRSGKFCKSRIVPIADRINTILRKYIEYVQSNVDRIIQSEAFLTKETGLPLSGSEIYGYLQRILRRTGKKFKRNGITLHSLRKAVAVHMMNKGADLDFVRRFLGHALIDTTMLYAKRRRARISLRRRVQQFKSITT